MLCCVVLCMYVSVCMHACRQHSSKQASRPAGKQASRQAGKQASMDGWMDVWMFGCLHVCMSLCLSVCMYVRRYDVCMHACTYVCIHIVHMCHRGTPNSYCRPRWPKAYWATRALTECLGQQYVTCGFMLMFNMSSLVLMLKPCGFWGRFDVMWWCGDVWFQSSTKSRCCPNQCQTIRLQFHVMLRLGAVVLVWFLHIKHPWIPKSVWHKWTYVMYCPSSSTLRDASLWGRLRLRQCSSVQAQASGESLWEIIHKTKPTPEKTSKSKIKCLCPT